MEAKSVSRPWIQRKGRGNATYGSCGLIRALTRTALSFGFAGQQRDAESGLIYLRARYYDPRTGRFLSKDPVRGSAWRPASQHAYVYALNNPVRYRDPSGREVAFGEAVEHSAPHGDAVSASACLDCPTPAPEESCLLPLSCWPNNPVCSHEGTGAGVECGGAYASVPGTGSAVRAGPVPSAASSTAAAIRANGGRPLPGYEGGRTFQNRPTSTNETLPPGSYMEHDVYPLVSLPGGGYASRGAERLVINITSGNIFYTPDHYGTFYPVP
jgi:RHS repeat-associated protein